MAKAVPQTQGSFEGTSDDPRILFTIDIEVEKHYSKKNGWTIGYRRGGGTNFAKRTGHSAFIRNSEHSKASEQFLVLRMQERKQRVGLLEPISCPMHAVWLFQLENHFTKRGKVNIRAGDCSNLVQGVEDALQKAEVILDDGLITSFWIQRVSGPNKIRLMLMNAW